MIQIIRSNKSAAISQALLERGDFSNVGVYPNDAALAKLDGQGFKVKAVRQWVTVNVIPWPEEERKGILKSIVKPVNEKAVAAPAAASAEVILTLIVRVTKNVEPARFIPDLFSAARQTRATFINLDESDGSDSWIVGSICLISNLSTILLSLGC